MALKSLHAECGCCNYCGKVPSWKLKTHPKEEIELNTQEIQASTLPTHFSTSQSGEELQSGQEEGSRP
jgi:hypothetical protein